MSPNFTFDLFKRIAQIHNCLHIYNSGAVGFPMSLWAQGYSSPRPTKRSHQAGCYPKATARPLGVKSEDVPVGCRNGLLYRGMSFEFEGRQRAGATATHHKVYSTTLQGRLRECPWRRETEPDGPAALKEMVVHDSLATSHV